MFVKVWVRVVQRNRTLSQSGTEEHGSESEGAEFWRHHDRISEITTPLVTTLPRRFPTCLPQIPDWLGQGSPS